MPTLLQINTVINSGSTGRIAEEIGQLALSQGWRSVIAYGRNPRPSQSETIRVGNDWDVKWHGIETRLFDRHGLASKKGTKKLIEEIKRISPDVIHLHNIHGYYLNYPLLFEYLSKNHIPVVWTLHDCWLITGHCAYFSFIGCKKWQTGCYNCPQKRAYPGSLFLDRSKKNWDSKKEYFTKIKNMTLVPVSNWLNKIINNSFLSEYPIKRIYNGVDLINFKPMKGKNRKTTLIGVASTWDKRKGLEDFIALRRLLPEDKYDIILVGLSESQKKSLPETIKGIIRTDSIAKLAELYSMAHIFINPTYEDNFPTTNLEALACGTPVITYKTGGSVEAVDNNTGIIVEQGDINGIVHAIKELMKRDPKLLSQKCRERAELFFNKNERYQEYIDLYNNILNQ